MRTYNVEARWTELKFFILFSDLFALNKSFADAEKIIEASAIFGEFDIIKIKNLANQIILMPEIRPSREEFVILASIMEIPVEYIMRKIKITPLRYSKILKNQKKDPMNFYHKLTLDELTEISKFLDCYEYMRKVGVPNATRRSLDHIQELRYGSPNNVPLRFS